MKNHNQIPFNPKIFPFYYGWFLIPFAAIGVIASIPGQTAGFAPFTDKLIEATDIDRSSLSMAYLIGTVISGFLLPQMGKFLDQIGPRLFVLITCLCFSLSLLFLSYIETSADFIIQATSLPNDVVFFALLLVGLFSIRFFGQGLLPLISTTLIGKWFDKWRGTAVSITGIVNSVAISIAPTFMNTLVTSLTWQGAWRYSALLIGPIVGMLGLIFYRPDPESCGLEVDGKKSSFDDKLKPINGRTLKEAKQTIAFWTVNLVLATHAMMFTAVAFHITALAKDYQINKDSALSIFISMTIISIPLGFVVSNLTRLIKMKYLIIFMAFGQIVAFVSFPFINHLWGYVIVIIGWGIVGGMFGSLYALSLPWYFGRRHLGSIQGSLISTLVISSALGPYFFSIVKELSNLFTPAFYIALIFPIVTIILGLSIQPPSNYVGK